MMYTCKGRITRKVTVRNGANECVEVEVDGLDCENEFEVNLTRHYAATRDSPEEGGEPEPSECPECGTEVDAAEVKEALKDSFDPPDMDDRRDEAAEFGGNPWK